MRDLLYFSHTVVPAHLSELATLGLLEEHEQVLVVLDGVLQDGNGRRLGGPTLHDYCLLTTMRVLLWARDYSRHLCYAFPLTDVCAVEAVGMDPLHANVRLTFVGADDEEQHYSLTLLPMADLSAATTLLRLAADAAQAMALRGVAPEHAGDEIAALLQATVSGYGQRGALSDLPSATDIDEPVTAMSTPAGTGFQRDPSALPPEQLYAAGRVARSAWDTLRRSLREVASPFDLGSGTNLRDLTDTLRAANELLLTVSSNPNAREMAMAFLDRRGRGRSAEAESASDTDAAPEAVDAPDDQFSPRTSEYREIPLRRRDQPRPVVSPDPDQRQTIPLRRRSGSGNGRIRGEQADDGR